MEDALEWKCGISGLPIQTSAPSPEPAHRGRAESYPEYAAKESHAWNDRTVAAASQTGLYPLPGKPVPSYAQTGDIPADKGQNALQAKTIRADAVSRPACAGGYESGTVEEIERHMAEGKPTMIYFSKTPIDYSTVDRDQYDLLMNKKDEWKNKGRIEEFSSLQEFKDKLNKQLPYLLSTHEYILSCSSSIPDSQEASNDSSVTLSSEAVEIIRLAGSTDGGIMKIRHLAGLLFQVGGENLDTSTPRKEATYVSALDELLNYGLVEAKGTKGQIYNLTKYGWDAYDKIVASNT